MPVTIHCHTDIEPDSFHPDNCTGYSVCVSFSYYEDTAEDEAIAKAKALYKKFLEEIPSATFSFYEVDSNNPTQLTDITANCTLAPITPNQTLSTNYYSWLVGQENVTWISGKPSSDQQVTVDKDSLTAKVLLDSAYNLPPNISSSLGLVRILRILTVAAKKDDDFKKIFAVPLLKGVTPPYPILYNSNSEELHVQLNGRWQDQSITLLTKPNNKITFTNTLVNPENGFIEVLQAAEGFEELNAKLKKELGSLFTVNNPLLNLDYGLFADPVNGANRLNLLWTISRELLLDPLVMSLPIRNFSFGILNDFVSTIVANSFKPNHTIESEQELMEKIIEKIGGSENIKDEMFSIALAQVESRPELQQYLLANNFISYLQFANTTGSPADTQLDVLKDLLYKLQRNLSGKTSELLKLLFEKLENLVILSFGVPLPNYLISETEFKKSWALAIKNNFSGLPREGGEELAAVSDELYNLVLSYAGNNISEHIVSTISNIKPHQEPVFPYDIEEFLKKNDYLLSRLNLSENDFDSLVEKLKDPQDVNSNLIKNDTVFLEAIQATCSSNSDIIIKNIFGVERRFKASAHESGEVNLQVIIDPTVDDGGVDSFSAAYQGVALLVKDQDDSDWSYANLVEVDGASTTDPIYLVKPGPFGINDGNLTVHAKYTINGTIEFDAQDGEIKSDNLPFMSARQIGSERNIDFKPMPQFAYGRTLNLAGFVVGKTGSLPDLLRIDSEHPWIPKTLIELEHLENLEKYIKTYLISRKVKIYGGKIDPNILLAKRLSNGDVRPMCADYPRVCVAPNDYFDLFRDAVTGQGQITCSSDMEIELKNIVFTNSPVNLTIQLVNKLNFNIDDPVPENRKAVFGSFPIEKLILRFTLGVDAPPTIESGEITFHLDTTHDNKDLWLRLSSDKAISMDEPVYEKLQPAKNQKQVLLLGEGGKNSWVENFGEPVNIPFGWAATEYKVFKCWFENENLLTAWVPTSMQGNDRNTFLARVRKFIDLLSALHDQNAKSAPSANVGYEAAILTTLPDPAVKYIRVKVTVLDSINKLTGESSLTHDFPAADLYSYFGPNGAAHFDKLYAEGEVGKIANEISDLFNRKLNITLEVGKDFKKNHQAKFELPVGCVASLTTQLLVDESYVSDGILDDGFLQLAIGKTTVGTINYLVLPGDEWFIETMPKFAKNDWVASLADQLKHRVYSNSRQYDLVFKPQFCKKNWQQIGGMEVLTQKWSPSGYPIYDWIEPRRTKYTSIKIKSKKKNLAKFDKQAFYGRADSDHQSAGTVPLATLENETVLYSHTEADTQAGFFRHRIKIHSRYKSIMAFTENGTCDAWKADAKTNDANSISDWIRIAMLAEAPILPLSVPQVESITPMTNSPVGDNTSPPIKVVFDEMPYGAGGLADRLIAEVIIGRHYKINNNNLIELEELRQEIGPDPRISTDAFSGHAVVKSEGPIGQTYDSPKSEFPAFPKSSHYLYPHKIANNNEVLSEHFLSLSFKRFLHPAWLARSKNGPSKIISLLTDIYLELPPDLLPIDFKYNDSLELFSVSVQDSFGDICFSSKKNLLDRSIGTNVGIQLIKLNKTRLNRLKILFKKSGSSISMTLFEDSKVESSNKENTLLVDQCIVGIGTYIFSIPEDTSSDCILKASEIVNWWPTKISETVSTQWTRTNYDFNTLFENNTAVALDEIKGSIEFGANSGNLNFTREGKPCWLQFNLPLEETPKNIQRHLAVVLLPPDSVGIRNPIAIKMLTSAGVVFSLNDETKYVDYEANLVVLETIAKILGSKNIKPSVSEYAHFPIHSTGINLHSKDAADKKITTNLSFYIRSVQGEVSKGLTFSLSAGSPPIEINTFQFSLPVAKWVAVILNMDINEGIVKNCGVIFVGKDGVKSEVSIDQLNGRDIRLDADSKWINLRFVAKEDENYLFDVSMLASEKSECSFDGSLDFSWILGRQLNREELKNSSNIDVMVGTPEAQAIFKSISDPIKISVK